MNTAKKNILLISYVFPPHYGIGGRRWAKHADALTKLNYRIHVICARNPFPKTSLWHNLVKDNPDIIIHQLPARYPKVMVNYDHNFLQKILYKLFTLLLPLFTKGSYLDRTIFWKRVMLKKAKQIISQNNIKHVICSGAPFGAMYYTTLLRHTFKDLFIMNDLRDPWTWGPNWGYAQLPTERMKYEKQIEGLTIENSDIITVPNTEMLNYLHETYPKFKNKIVELPHFFDIAELSHPEKTRSEKTRLVYYGNIYQDIIPIIEQTAVFLAKNKDKFSFDIYTDSKGHLGIFEKHQASNVQTYPPENAKTLFQKFSNYDYVFIMTPEYGKNNISTKFFEIFYSKTPIILFCNKGKAAIYLEENRLGIHVDKGNFETKMLDLHNNRDFNYNTDFNISRYELYNIAGEIDHLLTSAKVNNAKTNN